MMRSELYQYYEEKNYQKLQLFDQIIFLSKFAKNRRVSVFTHKCIWITIKCIRLFWNSLTLIDHNQKSDLKQKAL